MLTAIVLSSENLISCPDTDAPSGRVVAPRIQSSVWNQRSSKYEPTIHSGCCTHFDDERCCTAPAYSTNLLPDFRTVYRHLIATLVRIILTPRQSRLRT